MQLRDWRNNQEFLLSIEIFPPKTSAGDVALFDNLDCLMKYQPGFVSCTYGAGGSTRDRTMELCREINSRYKVHTTAHLTCVGSTRSELTETLNMAQQSGVSNIMALRGDPPAGETEFKPVAGGLTYANELVEMIRAEHPHFGVGVAAYPEVHPEAKSAEADLENFVRKCNSGADVAFTQLFYINENFFQFVEKAKQAGVKIPIIPGIMPITEYKRIKRITSLCNAVFPPELESKLLGVQDDAEAQFEIGVEYAIKQCRELIDNGAKGIHFYALNKSQACQRILDELNLAAV